MADLTLNGPGIRKQVLELIYSGSSPADVASALDLSLDDIKAIVKSDDFITDEESVDELVKQRNSKKKLDKLKETLKSKGEKVLFSKLFDDEDKADIILELKEIALGDQATIAHKLKAMEQLIKLAETPADQGLSSGIKTPAIIFQQFNSAIKVAQGEAAQYLKIPPSKSFATKELTV